MFFQCQQISLLINVCFWISYRRAKKEWKKKQLYRHIAYDLTNFSTVPHEFIKGKLEAEQHKDFQVPNTVHYIWYQDKKVDLRFDKALSILSAIKNLKPDAVYFHTNMAPTGKYFEMLTKYSVFKVIISVLYISFYIFPFTP